MTILFSVSLAMAEGINEDRLNDHFTLILLAHTCGPSDDRVLEGKNLTPKLSSFPPTQKSLCY